MSRKFIPNGDVDFAVMAESFARSIAQDPQRFSVTPEEAQELGETVRQFRAALQACRFGERSMSGTRLKEEARGQAEQIIRRLANQVRANRRIDAATRISLGIRPRNERPKALP